MDDLQGRVVVILLSGGLDSLVCGGLLREQGARIIALTVDYNQRHRIELVSSRRIASALGVVEHIILPLDLRRFGGSALTADIEVPKHRPSSGSVSVSVSGDSLAHREGCEIPLTYVPARNLVFLSLTLGLAEARSSGDIVIGVNALDYSGYPDCRPEFIAGFESLARLATKMGNEGHSIQIHAPLQDMTKAEIAMESVRLGLDAGLSWSCYDPTLEGFHCGLCESCILRRSGFVGAGLEDPTFYAS